MRHTMRNLGAAVGALALAACGCQSSVAPARAMDAPTERGLASEAPAASQSEAPGESGRKSNETTPEAGGSAVANTSEGGVVTTKTGTGTGAAATDGPAKPKSKEYQAAVAKLKSPDTWCVGAKALQGLGDPDAVVDLSRAWDSGPRNADRACLRATIRALRTTESGEALIRSADVELRRIGVRWAPPLVDASLLPNVATMAGDEDGRVQRAVGELISRQRSSAPRDAALTELVKSGSTLVKLGVGKGLREASPEVLSAIEAQIAVEADAEAKAALEEAIARVKRRAAK